MEKHSKKKRLKVAFSTRPPSVSLSLSSLRLVDCMTSRDFHLDVSAHVEVAAQRLKDEVNMRNFKDAILHNKHLFRGRTILDVGCGLGLLSLFAAKAGAARVYAVDGSNVVDYTRRIVKDNGYEGTIIVIKGHIETIELPADANVVDIIVCDWVGYSLLFQSTCKAVIFARDKWLRKDGKGLIFPDMAQLFMRAIEDGRHKNEHVEWWRDVYGFNMKSLRDWALTEPSFQEVLPKQVLSTQFGIKTLNLYTATVDDLKVRRKFVLETIRVGRMDAIITYFQIYFSKSHTPHSFSTDPWSAPTHWMQSVFFFDQPVVVKAKQRFYGGIEMYSLDKTGQCNLNNMEVGFEMYSGDPAVLNLEVDMRWLLNARMSQTTESLKNSKTQEDSAKNEQKCVKDTFDQKKIEHNMQKHKTQKLKHSLMQKLPVPAPYVVIGGVEQLCVSEGKASMRKKNKRVIQAQK